MKKNCLTLLIAVCLGSATSGSVLGQDPYTENTLTAAEGFQPPEAKIDDLAWIAGHWHGEAMGGQFEESEVVTVVKRRFVIERQRRQKYRCRCNANVVTAPAATKLQSGGRYSVEFGIEVAISKYLDHMPLERQIRTMRREGLEIDSQTLWDQLNVLGRHLEPVYDALGKRVLEAPVIHADETRWPLMGSKKK